jgi:CheY-like chemotaxis protein
LSSCLRLYVVDEFVEGERCLWKSKAPYLSGIDDDEDVLECEKSFLESLGYTVLAAASGGNGLELASIHLVDVVIVDYPMPEMNGQ